MCLKTDFFFFSAFWFIDTKSTVSKTFLFLPSTVAFSTDSMTLKDADSCRGLDRTPHAQAMQVLTGWALPGNSEPHQGIVCSFKRVCPHELPVSGVRAIL